MKKSIFAFMLALTIMATFVNCKHDPEGLNSVPPICFDRQIQPIFESNCNMAGCHGASSEEGYDFRSYAGIMSGVTPNDPNNSEVYKVITTKWGQLMPPKGSNPLNEEQRSLIYVWIMQGATDTVTCAN